MKLILKVLYYYIYLFLIFIEFLIIKSCLGIELIYIIHEIIDELYECDSINLFNSADLLMKLHKKIRECNDSLSNIIKYNNELIKIKHGIDFINRMTECKSKNDLLQYHYIHGIIDNSFHSIEIIIISMENELELEKVNNDKEEKLLMNKIIKLKESVDCYNIGKNIHLKSIIFKNLNRKNINTLDIKLLSIFTMKIFSYDICCREYLWGIDNINNTQRMNKGHPSLLNRDDIIKSLLSKSCSYCESFEHSSYYCNIAHCSILCTKNKCYDCIKKIPCPLKHCVRCKTHGHTINECTRRKCTYCKLNGHTENFCKFKSGEYNNSNINNNIYMRNIKKL